jgi:integrase
MAQGAITSVASATSQSSRSPPLPSPARGECGPYGESFNRSVSRFDSEDAVPERERRWTKRVEAWARAQEIEKRSQETYAEHLWRFPEYFAQVGFRGVYNATAVTREAVLAFKFEGKGYRGVNRGKDLAITTRAMDLGLLRSFLAFEQAPLALDEKLFRFRRGQVKPERIRRMDSREEIAAVLAGAPTDEARAVFALGLYGGLRPGEARAVTVADVEPSFTGKSFVRVRKGKWSKPRLVTLPRHARNLLLAAVVGKRPGDRVYPYGRTRHARDLAAACEAAGTRHYSPHDLRRTYASMMFAAGAPLEAVQDQLGHEDPQTTRHYQGPVRVDAAVALLETYLGA